MGCFTGSPWAGESLSSVSIDGRLGNLSVEKEGQSATFQVRTACYDASRRHNNDPKNMTPQEFIARSGPGGPAYNLNEEQGAQSHFIDLCNLLGGLHAANG
jgi:hypothetical protein